MFTQMKKRKYTQTRRAVQRQQTRTQIVEAAMALHEELGPAATSIKAVAERAGVQRLTVYRHFPDEASLFHACTTHWLTLHPPPALSEWVKISGPRERTHVALLAFYRYYRQTRSMWRSAYRDVDKVEGLKKSMTEFENYLQQVRGDLLAAWQARGKQSEALSVTLRHTLRFNTWQSLHESGLTDEQMSDLVISWLHGINHQAGE